MRGFHAFACVNQIVSTFPPLLCRLLHGLFPDHSVGTERPNQPAGSLVDWWPPWSNDWTNLPLLRTIKHYWALVIKRLPPHWQRWLAAGAVCSVHLLSPMLLAGPSKLLPNPTPLKSISITLNHLNIYSEDRHLGKWTYDRLMDLIVPAEICVEIGRARLQMSWYSLICQLYMSCVNFWTPDRPMPFIRTSAILPTDCYQYLCFQLSSH